MNTMKQSALAGWMGCLLVTGVNGAETMVGDPLQRLVKDGEFAAGAAMGQIAVQLEKDPANPRLLYNHAIAAYAAGQYDEALLSLDRVESKGSKSLLRKARFQKGNAEFRLGVQTGINNLDETISHWKQSLDHYKGVLKELPSDGLTRTNHTLVQKALVRLLLDAAKKSEENVRQMEPKVASQPRIAEKQLLELRNSHEKYSEAAQVDPDDPEAKEGRERTKDALAKALNKEGNRKVNAPLGMKFNPRDPQLPLVNTEPVQEGVGMLEDAAQLKPDDAGIRQDLKKGREKLADAQNAQAQTYLSLEERIAVPKEKLAILRMSKEAAQKGLDQVPEHKPLQETQEEIDRRLAKVHEEQGDMLSQMAEHQNLENEAMMLSQSLENFQQAGELKPQEKRIQKKADQTQQRLEAALEKLGDKLMQPGEKESLEQEAARLEGAQQALSELMGLKPSEKTGKKLGEVGEKLEGARGKLAQQGKPMPGGEGQQPMMAQGQQQMNQGMPMDGPPKVNTPGQRGPWSSPTMLRSLKDY